MTRSEIEGALDGGNLWAAMRNGRYWKVRRNGKTQTWKRDPSRFNIPIKAGLKSCGYVSDQSKVDVDPTPYCEFVISATDPNGGE